MKIFLQRENYTKKYFREYFNRFLIKKKKFLDYHLELWNENIFKEKNKDKKLRKEIKSKNINKWRRKR